MSRGPKAKMLAASAVLALTFASAVLIYWYQNQMGYHSVCAKNGMIRYFHDFGPFTRHRVVETPLSRVLVESGYRRKDDHQWLFAHGSGPRVRAAGPALAMDKAALSPEVASAIRRLIQYTDPATVEKWLARLFHPELSHLAAFDIRLTTDATNKADFLKSLAFAEDSMKIAEEGISKSSNQP